MLFGDTIRFKKCSVTFRLITLPCQLATYGAGEKYVGELKFN